MTHNYYYLDSTRFLGVRNKLQSSILWKCWEIWFKRNKRLIYRYWKVVGKKEERKDALLGNNEIYKIGLGVLSEDILGSSFPYEPKHCRDGSIWGSSPLECRVLNHNFDQTIHVGLSLLRKSLAKEHSIRYTRD